MAKPCGDKYHAAADQLGVHSRIAHAAQTLRIARGILEALNKRATGDGDEAPFVLDAVFPAAVEEALKDQGRPAKIVMTIIRMIDEPREMRDGAGKPLYGSAFEFSVLAPDGVPAALLKCCARAIMQRADAERDGDDAATIAVGSEEEAREIMNQIGTAMDSFDGQPRGNGDEAEGC